MADTNLRIQIGLRGTAEVTAGLQSIQASAARLKGGLVAIGAALAGAAGLGALGQAAINTAKLGGELSDLSARTGISARSLITLRQAFTDAGVGADAVGGSINRLQRTIVEAASSGGAAADALAGIGLSAQDLASLAPEDQFSRVASAISAVQAPAERSAAAMAIFGKSGAELLPLFSDGGALANAERVLGRMPEVLGRNVPILDNISDSFDRLPNKATQLFAGILDQLAPTVQSILDAFESIDLTGLGQRIGAFANVAIQQFRDGRFGEFVGLVIEAGFEQGVESGGRILTQFANWIGTPSFWAGLGNALMTTVNESLKSIAGLVLYLEIPFRTVAVLARDAFIYGFKVAVDAFASGLEKAINASISFLNTKLGTSMAEVALPRMGAAKAPSLSGAFDEAAASADAGIKVINDFFDASTDAFRQLTGTGGAFSAGSSARDQLGSMVNDQIANREKQAADSRSAEQVGQPPAQVQQINTRLRLQEMELELNRQLQQIQLDKSRVESSWLMTANQKYDERKKLLEKESELIKRQVVALRELQSIAPPTEQLSIEQKIVGLQGKQGGLQADMASLGPDPQSFQENFAATLINLQNQFGTVAQEMAQMFADVFNAATASISNSIQGLIYGTMTWGQALANIGTGIVRSIIQSFSDMLAQWIMTHVLMKGVLAGWAAIQSAFRAKDVAEANATEAAKTPALAANATLASIGSWGIAVGIGLAAIAGILAATGAFKQGGYTGDGDPNEFAGIVHRGEYVMPADAVDRIGVGTLEAISAGAPVPTLAPSTSTSPASINLNMGVFDDPRRLSEWARSNDGRTVLVDIMRQHAHEFSAA